MTLPTDLDDPVDPVDHPVVELRQYTLHPGRREALIALFEREFVESQEALGMALLGLFRDLDDADRFVWLRGFAGMAEREQALAAFYGGPVWQAHRDAANATMVDSDDVLLLRPLRPGSGLAGAGRVRAAVGGAGTPSAGLVVAQTLLLPRPPDADLLARFEAAVTPALQRAGSALAAVYKSELRPNNFPCLPVREGVNALVWMARFADRPQADAALRLLAGAPPWHPPSTAPVQTLRLAPTARSLFTA